MKKVFISQSNYIPWIGYFDAINSADEFIILDNVQYTKNDWRNRNKIKTPHGSVWLSIPVYTKGRFAQKINQAKVCNQTWAKKHWKSIQLNYNRAGYFKEFAPFFEELYLSKSHYYLSDINYDFIKLVCSLLEIQTKITVSDSYKWEGDDKTERLINLCKQANASHYISGPSAKKYLNENLFIEENIELEYLVYNKKKIHPQLFEGNIEDLSILDLLFNMGKNAKDYLVCDFKTIEIIS